MIAFIAGRLGISKPLVIGALVVLAFTIAGLGKCAYDRSIVKAHEAKVEAKNEKANRKADARAALQRREDDKRLLEESQEIKETVDEARAQGRDPRAAYYECVRLQQLARAARRPPADC